jgi:hypothetical protein
VQGCVRVLADGSGWCTMRQREWKKYELVSCAMADSRRRERKTNLPCEKVEKVINSGLCSGNRHAKEAGMQRTEVACKIKTGAWNHIA